VRNIVRVAGAKPLLLPPYSPDFNPIEQLFVKLKHGMRCAAPRSGETVHNAIADALDAVTPTERWTYARNAGGKST